MNQKLKFSLNNKSQIGLGQLGGIYKVFDEKQNDIVEDKVVKILLKNPEVPRQMLTRKKNLRFDFNFRNLKNLKHKNCVQILDYEEFNGYAAILMKKYDINLQTYSIMRNFDFQICEYLRLLYQVTDAYLKLIELGINYGRFKPQNIFVSLKNKGQLSFHLADYGFKMIDKDKNETDLNLQIPQVEATEEQDDMYQFGICIAQMGINYKMNYKHQLENFHNWLQCEQQQQIYFEQILHQGVFFGQILEKNFKLPPLIAFILNSMVVHNSTKRITWKDLMQLLQCIKSSNPIQLSYSFLNMPNTKRWEIINKIWYNKYIPRSLGVQSKKLKNNIQAELQQQLKN